MTGSSSAADKAMERIAEFSADLQIKRRATAKWSLAFYDLSVAIAAYGEALEVLATLEREEEERSVSLDLRGLLECPPEPHAVPLRGVDAGPFFWSTVRIPTVLATFCFSPPLVVAAMHTSLRG